MGDANYGARLGMKVMNRSGVLRVAMAGHVLIEGAGTLAIVNQGGRPVERLAKGRNVRLDARVLCRVVAQKINVAGDDCEDVIQIVSQLALAIQDATPRNGQSNWRNHEWI